jgi:hypothetical protein
MDFRSASEISSALSRAGELLAQDGERYAVVVLGGAAINLLAIDDRATTDDDIVAFTRDGRPGPELCAPPPHLPPALERVVIAVSRDMELEPDWMNTGPALQWQQGMPEGLGARVHSVHFGPASLPDLGLDVGLVDRYDLVFFKVYAAADHATPRSVHYRDLIALKPSEADLESAAVWVKSLNASPEYFRVVDDLIAHVRQRLEQE